MFGAAARNARRRASAAAAAQSSQLAASRAAAAARQSAAAARRTSIAKNQTATSAPGRAADPSSTCPSTTSSDASPATSGRRRTTLLQRQGSSDPRIDPNVLLEEDEAEEEEEDQGEDENENKIKKRFSGPSSDIGSEEANDESPVGGGGGGLLDIDENTRNRLQALALSASQHQNDDDNDDEYDDNYDEDPGIKGLRSGGGTRDIWFSQESSSCPSSGSTRRLVHLDVPGGPSYTSRRKAKDLTENLPSPVFDRKMMGRRRAVTISDHKRCALVQSNMKMGLGDIM